MATDIMPLKPYLETIRQLCETHSHDELKGYVLKVAGRQTPAERSEFLKELRAMLSSKPAVPPADKDEALLEEIEDLLQEVRARIESIEDGSIYEEEYGRGYGGYHNGYDDDDPPVLSDDQRESLEELVGRVGGLFLNRGFKLCAKAYARLMEFFALDYTIDAEVNEAEVHSRYFRALLESNPPAERAMSLADAMGIAREESSWTTVAQLPCLEDIFNACPGEIAERDSFLLDWKSHLATVETLYARRLYLEVVQLTDGVEGIKRYVRQHQGSQPLGYLAWIEAESASDNAAAVRDVCQEALKKVAAPDDDPKLYLPPSDNLRVVIARSLLEAGRTLQEPETVLEARRELFQQLQNDAALRDLLAQAKTMNRFPEELDAIRDRLQLEKDVSPLLLKIDILRGDWESVFAWRESQEFKPLGWSESASQAGVFIASLMLALCGEKATSTKVARGLLNRYASQSDFSHWASSEESHEAKAGLFFTENILISIQQHPLPDEQRTKTFQLIEAQVSQRIQAILDDRNRGAYERAAELLAAWAELLVLNGTPSAAHELVHQYVKIRYNRLTAFKRELAPYLAKVGLRM